MAKQEGWPNFNAIDKTGNQTGTMGEGPKGGGGGGDYMNKKNPYGPSTSGECDHGKGGAGSSHEDY